MGGRPAPEDPWGQVDDLEGTAHYATLGVEPRATAAEIKRAYRALAKRHHPDKGGDPRAFGRIQAAFEVLGSPQRRAVYDVWARELQFRYVAGGGRGQGQGRGGEGELLDGFEALGLACDPLTQLVVTCEVCRRPATKQCWTCAMPICEFCTLKRHWRADFPLHWPLINSPHMRERLARRELEKKRVEDASRLALEDPQHRGEGELRDIRAFRAAAAAALARDDRRTAYDLALARFYMWAQTPDAVIIACRVPTGYSDRELVVEASAAGLVVQAERSPALIDRLWDCGVDPSRPVETFRTEDNRLCAVLVPKAAPGERWARLFRGDPDGARCLEPPYCLAESDDDVTLTLALPFWTEPGDVRMRVGEVGLELDVRNSLHLRRAFWRNEEEAARRPDYCVVEPGEALWALEDDEDEEGERIKLLMVTLPKPPLTEEEVLWKKGQRQDNRVRERAGEPGRRGYRFFADDEDSFGLEDLLAALCFAAEGRAYVPPKPWARGEQPRWATAPHALPAAAQALLQKLAGLGGSSDGGGGAGAGAE